MATAAQNKAQADPDPTKANQSVAPTVPASADPAPTPAGVGPTISQVDDLGVNQVHAPVKALVESAPGHLPEDAGSDDLLARAQLKAPNLTADFVDHFKMSDEDLEGIASGAVPPPPYNGPDFGHTELHRTPGGWQIVPKGLDPADVGKNAVGRL